MEDIKRKILQIKKIAKKKKLISSFVIGNTSKPFKKKYYLTPIRFNSKVIFFGIVVYDEKVVTKIIKFVDGKIDNIFVDVEKKIPNKYSIDKVTANLQRCVGEHVNKSKLYTYKANDIVVDAVDTFLSFNFDKYLTGISGRKIAILGAGNIGYKLALKLVERGANVFLTRRDTKKLNFLVNSINLIKPKNTISKAYGFSNNLKASKNSEVLIASNSGKKIISKKIVKSLNKGSLIIDVGKGTIFLDAYNEAKKMNIKIYRADVSIILENLITNIHNLETLHKLGLGRKKIFGEKIVSGGILAEKNEFIVDNINKPKVFYGIANGSGDFNFGIKKKDNLYKRASKFKKKLNLL